MHDPVFQRRGALAIERAKDDMTLSVLRVREGYL
jgi:hypothetical protein